MKTEWLVWVWIVLIMIAGIWALSNGVKLMLNAFYSECQNGAFYTKSFCHNTTKGEQICENKLMKCVHRHWTVTNRTLSTIIKKIAHQNKSLKSYSSYQNVDTEAKVESFKVFDPSQIKNEPPNIYLINKTSSPYWISESVSMYPTILDSDTLVATDDFTSLKQGDIIWFWNHHQDIYQGVGFIFHRIVKINSTGYFTKGDNNDYIDPFVVKRNEIVFKIIGRLKR